MILRALLPDGWMPNPATAGAPFIICSADGTHHPGKAPPARERSHAPCAFAAAAPLAPPSAPAIFIAVSHDATRLAPLRTIYDPRTTTIQRANAARAPPAFS